MKRLTALTLLITTALALCACAIGGPSPTPSPSPAPTPVPKPTVLTEAVPDTAKTKIVIEMANGDKIKAELYPDVAPVTVANFQRLIEEKFYDGLTFHRVIDGFMIQGGDPLGTGTGGSDTKIKGEFSKNGVDNPIEHVRGVLSMARSNDMNSASSQFFIVQKDSPHLDGYYAAFGKVTEGIEIVDKIAVETPVIDQNGTVTRDNQPKIKSITFEQ